MNKIEKIKAEIERISSRAMNEEGQDICEYLLSFLSTLESEEPVRFRLKCEPRVVVTAAASLVHDLDEGDGCGIVFVNENNCLQTMVMLSSVWEKES